MRLVYLFIFDLKFSFDILEEEYYKKTVKIGK